MQMINYFLATTLLATILIYGLAFWYRNQRKKREAFTKALLKHTQLNIMTMSFQVHLSRIRATDRTKIEKHKAVNDAVKAFGKEIERLNHD